MGLDVCTFSNQQLYDVNVATAGCNEEWRSPMLQHKHIEVSDFSVVKVKVVSFLNKESSEIEE